MLFFVLKAVILEMKLSGVIENGMLNSLNFLVIMTSYFFILNRRIVILMYPIYLNQKSHLVKEKKYKVLSEKMVKENLFI
jgi:hypothetical protein